jgi:HD-like signal output (HDOD) protein
MSTDFIDLKMPDLTPSGMRVLEMVSSEEFEIIPLTRAIAQDPVLSSIILKYANSPIYRRVVEVNNVRQAISILGQKNVRMAVVVGTMRSFSSEPNPLSKMFWQHSFAIANLCKIITRMIEPRKAEDVELTGLLHEMGCLILIRNFPDKYADVIDMTNKDNRSLEECEKEVFGINHNELLARLVDEFRLPEITLYAMHDLAEIEDLDMLGRDVDLHMAVLTLAHHILYSLEENTVHPRECLPETLESIRDKLELSEEDVQSIIEEYKAVDVEFNA